MRTPSAKTFLFLTDRMCFGWGVSVVIENLIKHLKNQGIKVRVGCLQHDESYQALDIFPAQPNVGEVENVIQTEQVSLVVAFTSPFFEILPELEMNVRCIAWEHGDPTPEFFPEGREERLQVINYKQDRVYKQISAVITGSDFLRWDIGFPSAYPIYNGCDHVHDLGPKQKQTFASLARPVHIGTLARFGRGESFYKGNSLFLKLAKRARENHLPVEFSIMGRGEEGDRQPYLEAGIQVHLNASDEERARYLRNLDVFISCSQWEGFNLPLVEAQALGTASLAFDIGSHPEVTPLLCSSLDDALCLIKKYQEDRILLSEHSLMCYQFVRKKFVWERTVNHFLSHLRELGIAT